MNRTYLVTNSLLKRKKRLEKGGHQTVYHPGADSESARKEKTKERKQDLQNPDLLLIDFPLLLCLLVCWALYFSKFKPGETSISVNLSLKLRKGPYSAF